DDDTFHLAFGCGTDGAGQGRLALRRSRLNCRVEEHRCGTDSDAEHQLALHRFLPAEIYFNCLKLSSVGFVTESLDSRRLSYGDSAGLPKQGASSRLRPVRFVWILSSQTPCASHGWGGASRWSNVLCRRWSAQHLSLRSQWYRLKPPTISRPKHRPA